MVQTIKLISIAKIRISDTCKLFSIFQCFCFIFHVFYIHFHDIFLGIKILPVAVFVMDFNDTNKIIILIGAAVKIVPMHSVVLKLWKISPRLKVTLVPVLPPFSTALLSFFPRVPWNSECYRWYHVLWDMLNISRL